MTNKSHNLIQRATPAPDPMERSRSVRTPETRDFAWWFEWEKSDDPVGFLDKKFPPRRPREANFKGKRDKGKMK